MTQTDDDGLTADGRRLADFILGRLGTRLDAMDQRFETMDQQFERLETRMDGRFDKVDDRLSSLDRRLSTLEDGSTATRVVLRELDSTMQGGFRRLDAEVEAVRTTVSVRERGAAPEDEAPQPRPAAD